MDGAVLFGVGALHLYVLGHFTWAADVVQPHRSVGAEFEVSGERGKPAAHLPADRPGFTHVPATVTHGHPLSAVVHFYPAATLVAVPNHGHHI